MSEEKFRLSSKGGMIPGEEVREVLEEIGLTATVEAWKKLRELAEQMGGSYESEAEGIQALAKYVERSNNVLLDAIMKLEGRALPPSPDGEKRVITVEIEEKEDPDS